MDKRNNPVSGQHDPGSSSGEQPLPSPFLIGALTYGGSLLAGIGLFMYLKPEQTMIAADTGLPAFAIEMVFLGFAVNGIGAYLLHKRQRLMRARGQAAQQERS